MPELKDISFLPTVESDFEEFKSLRKAVMREHVERQGLPWDEWEEDKYHKILFDTEGLRVILCKGQRVGFIGVREEAEDIVIDRFCIPKEHQRKMIGTRVLQKIIEEPKCRRKNMKLEVLKMNPAIHLYIRHGFVFVSEDEILAYFHRRAETTESKPTARSPQI